MPKNNAHLNSKISEVRSLVQMGRPSEALQLLDKLAKKYPRNENIWFMRGVVLGGVGNFKEAVISFKRVVKKKPRHVLAYFNIGKALLQQGKIDGAIASYTKALKLEPGQLEIINALARIYANTGNFKKAIELYKRSLKLQPHNAGSHGNLAVSYFLSGELEKSCIHYRQALGYQKKAHYYDGLGAALCQQGKYNEAIDAHHSALELEPNNAKFHSNLLLTLNYLPDGKQEDIFQAHRKWDQAHALNPIPTTFKTENLDHDRRLRVGYISPDFRTHSVAYFFEPILENHDNKRVETFCYACTPHCDETTKRLQAASSHWRDISALNDSQAVAQIRSDKIDILVDLSGHTAKNRLTIMTARPAPVQVNWLGYPATTGLTSIDYRFTDEQADPAVNDKFYTEKLVRLSGCFLCYKPPSGGPAVSSLPVEKNGFMTFGSFNNLAKINEDIIELWSKLLGQVKGSRLLVKNPSLTDKATAARYMAIFNEFGISEERVDLLGLAPTMVEHLKTYCRIDVALDTFPYNGTTTTCEALYMGVPVITLTGRSHASRVSSSILRTIGLEEFITSTKEDYISVAAALTYDPGRLVELRKTLRSRMAESPMCDGKSFAHKIEQAYRRMWQHYCESTHNQSEKA